MFQAVEIDGEPYWDGGYLANPPIWPLIDEATPRRHPAGDAQPVPPSEAPKTPGQIIDRLNEIAFNAPLVAELRALAFMQR